MEDGIIAALLALLIIVTWRQGEQYMEKTFNSQIADLVVLNKFESGLQFQPSDFNTIDSALNPQITLTPSTRALAQTPPKDISL
jgi:hypothetical protein